MMNLIVLFLILGISAGKYLFWFYYFIKIIFLFMLIHGSNQIKLNI